MLQSIWDSGSFDHADRARSGASFGDEFAAFTSKPHAPSLKNFQGLGHGYGAADPYGNPHGGPGGSYGGPSGPHGSPYGNLPGPGHIGAGPYSPYGDWGLNP